MKNCIPKCFPKFIEFAQDSSDFSCFTAKYHDMINESEMNSIFDEVISKTNHIGVSCGYVQFLASNGIDKIGVHYRPKGNRYPICGGSLLLDFEGKSIKEIRNYEGVSLNVTSINGREHNI